MAIRPLSVPPEANNAGEAFEPFLNVLEELLHIDLGSFSRVLELRQSDVLGVPVVGVRFVASAANAHELYLPWQIAVRVR